MDKSACVCVCVCVFFPAASCGQDIEDLLMRGEDTRIYHTKAVQPEELRAYCKNDLPALEVRFHCLCMFFTVPKMH